MTEVNFHVPKVEGSELPQVGIFRFAFVDSSTGEVIVDSKVSKRVLFNTSPDCLQHLSNVVNSYLRGFLGGRDLALILELKHEVSDSQLDMFD